MLQGEEQSREPVQSYQRMQHGLRVNRQSNDRHVERVVEVGGGWISEHVPQCSQLGLQTAGRRLQLTFWTWDGRLSFAYWG